MLTSEQLAVQSMVRKGVETGVRTICVPGKPGTGRVTLGDLAAELVATGKTCTFVAFSDKAAAQLRSRGGLNAMTSQAFLAGRAEGAVPAPDVLVITQPEMLGVHSGATPAELTERLLQACKTAVLVVDVVQPKDLYPVVSNPAFQADGLSITPFLRQVMRQRPPQ